MGDPAAAEDCERDRSALAELVVAREQDSSSQSRSELPPLDFAVIDGHESGLEETAERDTVVEQIVNRLSELARRRLERLVDLAHATSSSDDRSTVFAPRGELASGSRSEIDRVLCDVGDQVREVPKLLVFADDGISPIAGPLPG